MYIGGSKIRSLPTCIHFYKEQLRQFQFYTYNEVLDRSTRSSFNLLKGVKISCISGSKENIVIGESCGSIYVLNKLLSNFVQKFDAYRSCVFFLHMSHKIPFLFCIGEDLGDSTPILKVFDLKTVNNRGIPFCCRQTKLNCSDENVMISCAVIHEQLTQMAIGYSSGTITIMTGDISGKKGVKEHEVKKLSVPITGLKFITEDDHLFLFITTLDSVNCMDLKRKNMIALDTVGCNPNCCAVLSTNLNDEFYVASDSVLIIL
ncbi:Vacuolar protein sorting-associated protein 11 [Thelohanellus kitauei]|uniref:Vacuolar protein sorting-associated protein 11 n=1 Tax=Thelohanellus kitauei TaxID=669202 RepID=A0A0C2MX22_THEKT|nr:Vacuolar protein sorting-associated protein 11 [Thelohanellus kitauei]